MTEKSKGQKIEFHFIDTTDSHEIIEQNNN